MVTKNKSSKQRVESSKQIRLSLSQTNVPKKPKGLSLGLGFQFVEYLGLGFFQIFCKFRIR